MSHFVTMCFAMCFFSLHRHNLSHSLITSRDFVQTHTYVISQIFLAHGCIFAWSFSRHFFVSRRNFMMNLWFSFSTTQFQTFHYTITNSSGQNSTITKWDKITMHLYASRIHRQKIFSQLLLHVEGMYFFNSFHFLFTILMLRFASPCLISLIISLLGLYPISPPKFSEINSPTCGLANKWLFHFCKKYFLTSYSFSSRFCKRCHICSERF